MDAEYFRSLYDYLYWGRDRVLAACDGMTEEEFAAPNGFVYKSVRGILVHALAGETLWLARAREEAPPAWPKEEETPTVEALRSRWAAEEAKQRSFLAGLSDADVSRELHWTGRDGNPFSMKLWEILTMMFHHTVQHRSEAAEALSMIGRSPGDFDYMFYKREMGAKAK